ncbi:hypothetical protein BC939DRAFT_459370 [Gamsiella multidivaricata]|uniref:uncharacterized protein n=1 Tax=Gamsiella multidivaricata TaxID=101098 RepID=UPI00221F8FED|nr:uncharacterized protein BC939DRAFT_459370 [Gamsiella multidivaricata]KAI7819846.1 hypothetical protein BC939DRAFT_459370 [Gamsiella multidivaricata]
MYIERKFLSLLLFLFIFFPFLFYFIFFYFIFCFFCFDFLACVSPTVVRGLFVHKMVNERMKEGPIEG